MSTVPTANPLGTFRFLDLPAELRNKVYTNVLTRDPTKTRGAHPQLLATCRKIHDEASGLLYSLNQIDVYVHHHSITWHGSSYRGSGAIHWLLPFNKPGPWHRPSFHFLRMAEHLTIHVMHHQHPNCARFPNQLLLHLSRELNWIFKLYENLKWLVRQISVKNHHLKNLIIRMQINNGIYLHPSDLVSVEALLLAAFKKMRGVPHLTISPLWNPERAFQICGRMTQSLGEKYVLNFCSPIG